MDNYINKEYIAEHIKACWVNGRPKYSPELHEVLSWIDEVPSEDVQPVRHGKFIGTEYDGYSDGNPVYYEWKCSECGCIFEEDEPTYKYCPNCGAEMK